MYFGGLSTDSTEGLTESQNKNFFEDIFPSAAPESPPKVVSIEEKTELLLKDGRTLEVPDSVLQGVLVADGQVLLQEDANRGYLVSYTATDESFTLTLLSESLRTARLEAQRFLLERLGISEDDACLLRHVVLVPQFVNEKFSGENLGFNFCPGAVELP